MFFRGRLQRSPDSKGRIMLPPEYREILLSRSPSAKLALTTFDECIVAFPLPEWEEFEQKLFSVRAAPRRVRDFRRQVAGGAVITEPDGQGRIRLGQEQLEYAGIKTDAILMGQGPRFEIWAPERLTPVVTDTYDDVSSALADAGIDILL